MKFPILLTSALALALAGCSGESDSTNQSTAEAGAVGAKYIYAISNKADGNTIVGFARGGDGQYAALGEFATGGKGTGDLEIPALKKDPEHPLANGDDPLISANSLVASNDGQYAIAVNPGDATISLMTISGDGKMTSAGTAPASDKFPVSVAINGDMVVAASVGDDNEKGSIAAYKIADGKLTMVEGSRRDLAARPSTIDFSSDGEHVIVDELITGKIKVFAVAEGNLSADPSAVINSPREADDRFQAIPVGFEVKGDGGDDILLVSEARFLTHDYQLRAGDGAVVQSPNYSWQTGSLSTYSLSDDGTKLSLVSGDVLTGDAVEGGEIANCWVALSADGNVLYAVNALSSSISSFNIGADGSATMRNLTAWVDDSRKPFLSDIATSTDGAFVYQLVGNQGEILVLKSDSDYNLETVQTLTGLPQLGSYGLLVL